MFLNQSSGDAQGTFFYTRSRVDLEPGPALEAGKRGGRPGPPVGQGPTPKYANHTIIFNVFVYLYELLYMNIVFACRVKYL